MNVHTRGRRVFGPEAWLSLSLSLLLSESLQSGSTLRKAINSSTINHSPQGRQRQQQWARTSHMHNAAACVCAS